MELAEEPAVAAGACSSRRRGTRGSGSVVSWDTSVDALFPLLNAGSPYPLRSYKMPIIITRGNNVYGPHQFPEKLIPKFIIRASRGRDLPIHGDGDAVRSYLFVEDVARAFDAVLHKARFARGRLRWAEGG